MDSSSEHSAGGTSAPLALSESLGSLSVSDGSRHPQTPLAQQAPPSDQPTPPSHQSATQPDQLQEVLKLAADLTSSRLPPLRPEEPLHFMISRESWYTLYGNSQFNLCEERKLFRAAYDSLRSVVTITPPPGTRHETFVELLTEAAYMKKFTSQLSSMTVATTETIEVNEGRYQSSYKLPDLAIAFEKGSHGTVVEVGISQSAQSLRSWIPIYLENETNISRVVLIKVTTAENKSLSHLSKDDLFNPDTSKFRFDQQDGSLKYGEDEVIGKTKEIIWEVWEHAEDGQPLQIFQETIPYGSVPSRPLPFFQVHGSIAPSVAPVEIQPAEVGRLWSGKWEEAVRKDGLRRMKSYHNKE